MESWMDEQEWNDSQSAWFIYLFCRWYLSGEMERTSVRYDCSIETQTNAKETWKNGWWWNTLNSMISFPGRITRRISPQFSSRERSITRARYIASRGPRMASWWRPEATTKLSNWCASTPTHQISKVNLSIQRERERDLKDFTFPSFSSNIFHPLTTTSIISSCRSAIYLLSKWPSFILSTSYYYYYYLSLRLFTCIILAWCNSSKKKKKERKNLLPF